MADSAFEYLNSHTLLFLATSSSDGNVHVSPMFYATKDKSIFFSAPDNSETAKNLKQNPTAAIAVADPVDDWDKARGVQMEGPVTELDGPEETDCGHLFQQKFPHLGDAAMHTHYWRLDPDDVHFVNNDGGGNETFEALGQTWNRHTTA
jgi:uncharacterized protein YhbP (UPF0306 family)